MPRRKSSIKSKTIAPKTKPVSQTDYVTNQLKSFLKSLNLDTEENQSKLSMVLGALIILVIGILVFNYFNKPNPALGPSQQIENAQDVSPDNLPGKYIIKEGDTLFSIAEKYYKDGYKFDELANANNLEDPNSLQAGQVLNIPLLATSPSPSAVSESIAESSEKPSETPSPSQTPQPSPGTETLSPQNSVWGSAITGDSYTVVEDDWLSKIADRAYGDANAYDKIAQANNIQDPDLIYPGQVLTIPR